MDLALDVLMLALRLSDDPWLVLALVGVVAGVSAVMLYFRLRPGRPIP